MDVQHANVLVGGYFSLAVVFGNTTYNSDSNSRDIFIAKYTSNGTFVLVTVGGNYREENIGGVAFDSAGSFYAVGGFRDTITFGSLSVSAGMADPWEVFVVKFNATGKPLYLTRGGKPSCDDEGSGITVDASDNVYITGFVCGGGGTFDSIVVSDSGTGDPNFPVVVKYNSTLAVQWVKAFPKANKGISLHANSDGRIYFGAIYKNSFVIDTFNITLKGVQDVLVGAFDTLGNIIWLQGFGSIGSDAVSSIKADVAGNLYVVGIFSASMNIGSLTLATSGGNDMFVVKFNPSGNVVWAEKYGSNINDVIGTISVDPFSAVLNIGGKVGATTQIGSSTVAAGMFFAKMSVTCNQCGVGTYSSLVDIIGNSSCQLCSAGRYSTALGATRFVIFLILTNNR